MIYLIIYIIGYIFAYYLSRKNLRNNQSEDYNWESVSTVLIVSILSWFWVFIMIITTTTINFPKPPKWL